MQPINVLEIRRTLAAQAAGQSSHYVYAQAIDGLDHRIVAVRYSKGQTYGRVLLSGKWIVIVVWEIR